MFSTDCHSSIAVLWLWKGNSEFSKGSIIHVFTFSITKYKEGMTNKRGLHMPMAQTEA